MSIDNQRAREILTGDHVAAIAAELASRAGALSTGAAALAERKDLEPAAVMALTPTFGERVEKDRKIRIPEWDHVGNVDLLARDAPASKSVTVLGELKWCGPGHDILYEAIWDMFKLALATTRDDHPSAYLVAGAERSLWETSAFADLFDSATHRPVELCARRLPDRQATLAWDDLLRGGYDHHPHRVPARTDTRVVGRAAVGDWELHAVQLAVGGEDWIAMDGGWPHGKRPEGANHPQAGESPSSYRGVARDGWLARGPRDQPIGDRRSRVFTTSGG